MQGSESTHEQKIMASKLKFSIDELKRLYYDMQGLEKMSMEEIKNVREEGKHLHASADTYYYKEREELITQYYERLAKFQKLIV